MRRSSNLIDDEINDIRVFFGVCPFGRFVVLHFWFLFCLLVEGGRWHSGVLFSVASLHGGQKGRGVMWQASSTLPNLMLVEWFPEDLDLVYPE